MVIKWPTTPYDKLRTILGKLCDTETRSRVRRNSFVPRIVRIISMISMVIVAALAVLALLTQAGVLYLQRAFPQRDIGRGSRRKSECGRSGAARRARSADRDDPWREFQPGGHAAAAGRSARPKPSRDLDRPAGTRLEHARAVETDSTPAIQGRMIEEALEKLGVGPVILVVHSWSGALGARMALDYPAACRRPRDAGAGHPSLARRRRLVQQRRHHARDRPAARLHRHAAARAVDRRGQARATCSCRKSCRHGFVQEYRDAALAASARVSRQRLRPRDAEGRRSPSRRRAMPRSGADHGDFRRRRQDGVDQHPFAPFRGRRAETRD